MRTRGFSSPIWDGQTVENSSGVDTAQDVWNALARVVVPAHEWRRMKDRLPDVYEKSFG